MSIDTLDGIEPGDVFTTDGHDVWRVVSFCHHPTITLKNIETGKEIGGAVGCLNVRNFVKLVPAGPLDKRSIYE